MCGIVIFLPVYDADEGSTPVDVQTLAGLLPEVPPTDPLGDGIPEADLLGDWGKALAYAADQFRSRDVLRLVGDPATDGAPIRAKLQRLEEWSARVDRALDAQPIALD